MVSECKNREEIISLWQEAFGDTREDIAFFIDNLKHGKCLMYYENGVPVSMFFLVDSNCGGYVYAACTKKEYRGRGCMTKLLKAAPHPLCLIPASDSLVEYYKQRGLTTPVEISSLRFDESPAIIEYLLDGYELSVPKALTDKE